MYFFKDSLEHNHLNIFKAFRLPDKFQICPGLTFQKIVFFCETAQYPKAYLPIAMETDRSLEELKDAALEMV